MSEPTEPSTESGLSEFQGKPQTTAERYTVNPAPVPGSRPPSEFDQQAVEPLGETKIDIDQASDQTPPPYLALSDLPYTAKGDVEYLDKFITSLSLPGNEEALVELQSRWARLRDAVIGS